MDELDRAVQRSEEKFFEECDPGNSELVCVMIMVLLLGSWSVSPRCGVVHQIRCIGTCSTGKTSTGRSAAANTGTTVKGQATH